MVSTKLELKRKDDEEAAANEDEDTGTQVAPIIKLEEVAVSTEEENEEPILELYVFFVYICWLYCPYHLFIYFLIFFFFFWLCSCCKISLSECIPLTLITINIEGSCWIINQNKSKVEAPEDHNIYLYCIDS